MPVRRASIRMHRFAPVHRKLPLRGVPEDQRASYMSELNVPISAVQISGEVRRSVRVGDTGGKVENGFCAKCGSRMFSYAESLVRHMNIMATSLDDPSWFRPSLNIYAASTPPWHQVDRSLPSFDTVPPSNMGAGQ